MTPYIAPLADIRFALRELNDLASLAALPDCEALADAEPVPIICHPDVGRMLLTMRSQIEAMRAVAYVIAAARDVGIGIELKHQFCWAAELHRCAEQRRMS
jgi:alkylation response protein AidB-like acyl-CoA dehydrogenase